MMVEAEVVVVGGGLSGLSAARRILAQRPHTSLVLLEARDRLGGRTQTIQVSFDGSAKGSLPVTGSLDVGGQWIGPQHREMLSLIQLFGLELVEQFYPDSSGVDSCRLTDCVGYECQALSAEDAEEVRTYTRLVDALLLDLDPAAPWSHPQAQQLDYMSIRDHILTHIRAEAAREEMLLFAQTALAFPPADVSMLFFLFDLKSGGGLDCMGDGDDGAQKWKVKGGLQQVSQRLADVVSTGGGRIVYSSEVSKVSTSADGSLVVRTAQAAYSCKRLVMAIPPLLIPAIVFDPPLPPAKLSMCRLVKGRAAKVFLVYSSPFWLHPASDTAATSSSKAHFTKLGLVHNMFDSHVECAGAEYPSLVGIVTGDAVLAYEKLSEAERRATVLRQVHLMYQDKAALSPLYFGEKCWGQEEFSGGCYAGVTGPTGALVQFGESIRRPVGAVHWAATETAVHFHGYMEGAVLAGLRAADEALDALAATD